MAKSPHYNLESQVGVVINQRVCISGPTTNPYRSWITIAQMKCAIYFGQTFSKNMSSNVSQQSDDDVRHLYFLSHKSTDLSLKCPLKIVCYRRALIIWNVSLLTDIFYLKCVSVVDIDNYPFMSAKTLLASQVWRLQVKNSPVQRLHDAMTQPTYVLCYTNFNHRNVGNNRHREILFGMC